MIAPDSKSEVRNQKFRELSFEDLTVLTNILIISSISCKREENKLFGIISL